MKKFRFHVVSLPHTQTTDEYSYCAYTQKVRKFCNMMTDLGHTVYLYASEDNEARVADSIPVISKQKQREFYGELEKQKLTNIRWDSTDPAWAWMNQQAVKEINKRIQPKDFICLIGGVCQEPIAEAFKDNISVEYGIGYTGVFAKYRVFESYAHMHFVQGYQRDDNGRFYDTVIPNYYDVDEFPFADKRADNPYFLFIGRLIDRKGYRIAQQVCERLGRRLILAGQVGESGFSGYGEYVGVVGVEERAKLMSEAEAVFVPTTYLEPFGGVHAEAMLTGAPVITTNFGVFTETVLNGFNGFRCDTFDDFLKATIDCEDFDNEKRQNIRKIAQARFSDKTVAGQYQSYFERLDNLWDKGWYTVSSNFLQ